MTTTPATERSPFVYASALAIDVATMKLVPEADTIEHEIEVVLSRVAARLAAAGLGLEDVVKTTCYVREASDVEEVAAGYAKAFPGQLPVTNTVVLGLAGNCRVQIDTVAARRG
ncbi:MAG: RidA family protein [Nocardioides sp.]|uniref:RidA family protein n=1 Tax=Nocardioides sp. TaxID=35761 RepID=UPI0039E5A77A